MKTKFIRTEGPFLEAEIEINEKKYIVMDEFDGEKYLKGQEIELHLCPGLFSEEETWESMFNGNPNGRRGLEQQSSWRYRAYGLITRIKPEVMVDIGFQEEFECPIQTNDSKVIGESIAFTIERLEGHAK